jgi:hypothetical protein
MQGHQFASPAPKVRPAADAASPGHVPLVRDVLSTAGRPLDHTTRDHLGARFGHDFSHVRVHTDDRAARSAQVLRADAYTIGSDIVFGANRYRPGTDDGDRLIAHELTHVLQQGPVGITSESAIVLDEPGTAYDAEAAAIAAIATAGEPDRTAMRRPDPGGAPVRPTRIRRAPNTVVVQRALAGALVGGGIGAVVGGLLGFAVGGPIGALVGGILGGAAGALIGALASPFPSYREIVQNADVQAQTSAAWASTLAAATPASRREEGFWIRYNKGTSKYEFTPTILGPVVGPLAGGSVVLGARPADVAPDTAAAIYTVGSFHTHTPTAFRPVGRAVGPSGADQAADTSDDVVGVVYDYVESPPASGNIPAAHPLASPAQLYPSGPDRRQRV